MVNAQTDVFRNRCAKTGTLKLKGIKLETITIHGEEYVKKSDVNTHTPRPEERAVFVVDRGWIFAGDVTRKDGRIILTNSVWVRNWSSIGFDGVIKNPKDSNVELRKMYEAVNIPDASEIFCIPVSKDWGL